MDLFMKFEKMHTPEEIMAEMQKMSNLHQKQEYMKHQSYDEKKNPWTILSLLILNQMNYHGL